MNKLVIGIPLGDPCGIGPEIVVKTFNEKELYEICNMLLIGDKFVVDQALQFTGLNLDVNIVTETNKPKFQYGTIDLIDMDFVKSDFKLGEVNALCGRAAYTYVKKAGDMAMENLVDVIATPPINKQSMNIGGVPFIGHTEIFEDISGVKDPLTMFEVEDLRIFFLSRHVSLRKSVDFVKYDRILEYIERCTQALERLGVTGRLAIAGLNPHSGENGLFGSEEVEEIAPAVKEAQRRGFDVVGPIAGDSVFYQALQGKYAGVLSLYHDQGHIAAKTYNFEKTIALTNSMPFLRTSVDHGTAYDIAGKNIASPVSMIEAVKVAAKYGKMFNK